MVLKKIVSKITEKWLLHEKDLNVMLGSFLVNLTVLWHKQLPKTVCLRLLF